MLTEPGWRNRNGQKGGKQDYSRIAFRNNIGHAQAIYPIFAFVISNMPRIKGKLTLSLIG